MWRSVESSPRSTRKKRKKERKKERKKIHETKAVSSPSFLSTDASIFLIESRGERSFDYGPDSIRAIRIDPVFSSICTWNARLP